MTGLDQRREAAQLGTCQMLVLILGRVTFQFMEFLDLRFGMFCFLFLNLRLLSLLLKRLMISRTSKKYLLMQFRTKFSCNLFSRTDHVN